ncbi:MAG: M23 family metallopeptidase [Bacteroidales bacterium]|jgi:murein DD-endopeptidase MepM/ murein hydrolase activator NlpD|nr:M23 family metallopeptidase [Bacteroidales bacterium]
MAKRKKKKTLIFNPHSLSVQESKKSRKAIVWNILSYILVGGIFFGFAILLYPFISSEALMLKKDIISMENQYKYLSKKVGDLGLVLQDIHNRDADLYRLIFEAEPPLSMAHIKNNVEPLYNSDATKIVLETSQKIDSLSIALYNQSKSFDQIYYLAKQKNEILASMPSILPVNKTQAKLFSGFGPRKHPIYKDLRLHTGIDFAGPIGTPIYSTGSGTVIEAGSPQGYSGYGILCVIDHSFGYKTLYGHMSKIVVRQGQKVKRGDLIGFIGATGDATGAHLHYEVWVNDKKVNPVYYFFGDISPEEYKKIYEKAQEINQSMS